jgi:hypothetical protein
MAKLSLLRPLEMAAWTTQFDGEQHAPWWQTPSFGCAFEAARPDTAFNQDSAVNQQPVVVDQHDTYQ